MKPVELIGKRVQLIKGMDPPYQDVQIWCAGTILVGSKGTVIRVDTPFVHIAIQWG